MKKFTTWFKELSRLGKVAVVTAGLMVTGTMFNAAATPQSPVSETVEADPVKEEPKPEVTYKTVEATEAIDFDTQTVDDPNLNQGTTEVRTKGVNGVRTTTYEITYIDGEETNQREASSEITTAPITEVIARGTYVAPPPPPPAPVSSCDPNYTGCVPIASDVDCVGGSGNGPAYTGYVQVIGVDIYGLDRDGDGHACE